MSTRSTEEAMGVLEEHRAFLIASGRRIAAMLIEKHGSTHSRAVRAEMQKVGLLAGYTGSDYWLGALFNSSDFEPTGQWYEYSDSTRNIHERRVRTWKLSTAKPTFKGKNEKQDRTAGQRATRRKIKKLRVLRGQLQLSFAGGK